MFLFDVNAFRFKTEVQSMVLWFNNYFNSDLPSFSVPDAEMTFSVMSTSKSGLVIILLFQS